MKKLLLFVLVISSVMLAQFSQEGRYKGELKTHAIEAVLVDQAPTAGDAGYGSACQKFPDFSNAALESADDFTVPEDQSWSITSISAFFFFNVTGSQFESIEVYIYEDAEGIPGEEVYSLTGYVPADPSMEDVTITLPEAVQLIAGTYWLEVLPVMSFESGTNRQTYWLRRVGQEGYGYSFQDAGGLLGTATTWGPGNYSNAPNDKDLTFILSGTSTTVPVELTSFTAVQKGTSVVLNWETATEINNKGFEVERSVVNAGVESAWSTIGYVDGKGTTTEKTSYTLSDNLSGINAETVQYRLKQIDFDGTFEYSDVINVGEIIPTEYSVSQNYPNPFNPSTKIAFALPVEAQVTLKVYNALGQEVSSMIDGNLSAGTFEYSFNATSLTSGIYFYQLNAKGVDGSNFNTIKKMMLVK